MRNLLLIAICLGLANCAGTIGVGKSTVRITSDRGGYINRYVAKYRRWARDNRNVVIDGYCASSCTTFIAIIPKYRVCVTRRAILGFHGAWNMTLAGKREDVRDTHLMTEEYTPDIIDWINQHGGLRTYKTMLLMKWPETANHFNVCP